MADTARAVHTECVDGIAVVRLDDGKANALGSSVIAAVHAGLDRAEKEARATVLTGRSGRFCGGFDLGELGRGGADARRLVAAGAELCLRLVELPIPVVVACTGHAIAAGALLLLAADRRIGARGDFKIGLNEVALGMTLPDFAVRLARARLCPPHFLRATAQAEIYAPDPAVDAGFLDTLASSGTLEDDALDQARALAALDPRAFRNTKRSAQAQLVRSIRERLDDDLERLLPGP